MALRQRFWIWLIRTYYRRRLNRFEQQQKILNRWQVDLNNVRELCKECLGLFSLLPVEIYSSQRTLMVGYDNVEQLALHYRYIIDWLDDDLQKSYDYRNQEISIAYLKDFMLDNQQRRVEVWMVVQSLSQVLDVVSEGLNKLPPAQQGVVKRALTFPLTITFSLLEALICLALVDETKLLRRSFKQAR